MRGKRMPQIGRVEISIIEEPQSRWLAFNQKELDYISRAGDIPPPTRFDGDSRMKPEFARARASPCTG